MAKINIYINDSLRDRVDLCGEEINWSELVRPVIEAAIAASEKARMEAAAPDMLKALALIAGEPREDAARWMRSVADAALKKAGT